MEYTRSEAGLPDMVPLVMEMGSGKVRPPNLANLFGNGGESLMAITGRKAACGWG